MVIKLFLSGSVKKNYDELNIGKTYWEKDQETFLAENLLFPIECLNPNTVTIDKNDSEARFREDLLMLLNSDFVIVDANDKKGIGIGSEMIFAKMNRIPVLSISAKNSHYRKNISDGKEWIHPFIYELSDKIFESVDDLVVYLNECFKNGKIQRKSPIDAQRVLDKLSAYDAGYDEGYTSTAKFWGDKPARLVTIAANMIEQEKPGNVSCLDLGCGHGKNSMYLANLGFKVTAMDASYYAIEEARQSTALDIEWKVRDIKKLRIQDQKYDLILMTGSLHCLSTKDEVLDVVNKAKLSTKIGGYNVLSAFNDEEQDLAGHASSFSPILLAHDEYAVLYQDWKIIECSNTILDDEHPHNHIKHKHSITRILAQRV